MFERIEYFMDIRYRDDNCYTQGQVQELFESVNWLSANYPERLMKALYNCETVFTAWDDEKLVGLVNAIDDGELTAYVHYLCVNPEYQNMGIGQKLLAQIKDKYKDYLYIIIIAENDSLTSYYKNNKFEEGQGTHVMEIINK